MNMIKSQQKNETEKKEIGTCLNLTKYLCQYYNERLMIFIVNSALLSCGKKMKKSSINLSLTDSNLVFCH